MLKVKLSENNGEMEIKEYTLSDPFNLVSDNNKQIIIILIIIQQ